MMIRDFSGEHKKVLLKFGNYAEKLDILSKAPTAGSQLTPGSNPNPNADTSPTRIESGQPAQEDPQPTSIGGNKTVPPSENTQGESINSVDTPGDTSTTSPEHLIAASSTAPQGHPAVAHGESVAPTPNVEEDHSAPDQTTAFTITLDDMRKQLTHTVQKLVDADGFTGIISIKDPEDALAVPWEELQANFRARDIAGADSRHVTYGRGNISNAGDGWTFLRQGERQRFEFPSAPGDIPRPSEEDVIKFLNTMVDDGPEDQTGYYVGKSLDDRFNSLLDSGAQLAQYEEDLPGIKTTYWHLGETASATPLHCEDAAFWSCNLTLAGWKVWIVINKDDNDKLHDLLRRHWVEPEKDTSGEQEAENDPTAPGASVPKECDNWVRHLCLLFNPKRLDYEGIRFRIHCAGARDMVITRPYEYHMVINYSPSLAISTNFLLPGEPLLPDIVRVCAADGLYTMVHPAICQVDGSESVGDESSTDEDRSGEEDAPVDAKKKKKKTIAKEMPTLNKIVSDILEIDPNCKIPSYAEMGPLPDSQILKLATLIWSRPALFQFANLVYESKREGPVMEEEPEEPEEDHDLLVRRLRNIDAATKSSDLVRLQVRLAEFHLARDIERHIISLGRKRANKDYLKSIYDDAGWTKLKFEGVRTRANKWLALCRDGQGNLRPGLLCFIFFSKGNAFDVSHTEYQLPYTIMHYKSFAALLEDHYTDVLCRAAEAFLETLNGSKEIQFQFEIEEEPVCWKNIDEVEIERLLEVAVEET
ncbi:lysine -specific demethylase 4c [Fusarium albosuccineum]|uniref:Lysine -specific demethylase 4c n=1 Tax=Fusarium albosuccineum TaxID=1237068 RepID=A0A8H4L5Q0_9HYPO|nr:lysine -specific demethylase 4c [Fusarium albosuccineum]